MRVGDIRGQYTNARRFQVLCNSGTARHLPPQFHCAASVSINSGARLGACSKSLPLVMETPLKSEHLAAKAQLIEANGCVLPETFAGFESEYRAAREGVALLDTNWHAITVLTGPDRVRYLNAIVTNSVQALKHGTGCLALLLSPQGRILAEFEIYSLADKLLLLSHASVRERTNAALDKYIIMDDVHLEDATEQMGS